MVWHALCLDWTRRPLDLLVGYRHNHIGHNAIDLLVFYLGNPTHFGCGVRSDPLRARTRVLGSCPSRQRRAPLRGQMGRTKRPTALGGELRTRPNSWQRGATATVRSPGNGWRGSSPAEAWGNTWDAPTDMASCAVMTVCTVPPTAIGDEQSNAPNVWFTCAPRIPARPQRQRSYMWELAVLRLNTWILI